VQTQAADALRKFEESQTVQSPTPKESHARETKPPPATPKPPLAKVASPSPTKEPSLSMPWSIVAVLIVAACSLLWLLLKRRSWFYSPAPHPNSQENIKRLTDYQENYWREQNIKRLTDYQENYWREFSWFPQ
jgi:hypothetical protein